MVERGQLWWAELGNPTGSEPGFKRPVLVIQSDSFNRSRINTVIVLALTSNMRLMNAPGNVTISTAKSGLSKDSVANVSQLLTVNKDCLTESIGKLDKSTMQEVDAGIRLVLSI